MTTKMLQQCPQGHSYDPAQNSQCPYCGVGSVDKTMAFPPSDPVRAAAPQFSAVPPAVPAKAAVEVEKTRIAGVAKKPDAPQSAAAVAAVASGDQDPVVGWLVCVKGPDRGRDFRVVSGWNTIGRDSTMTIAIPGDASISRHEHAKLLYEPKKASFFVTTGSGRNAVYLNGEVVLQSMEVKADDIIELGDSHLRFVPLCGEQFRWD